MQWHIIEHLTKAIWRNVLIINIKLTYAMIVFVFLFCYIVLFTVNRKTLIVELSMCENPCEWNSKEDDEFLLSTVGSHARSWTQFQQLLRRRLNQTIDWSIFCVTRRQTSEPRNAVQTETWLQKLIRRNRPLRRVIRIDSTEKFKCQSQ